MADPVLTQPQREALLRNRSLQTWNAVGQVGNVVGDAGRILQGKDPLHTYEAPGADNLTAQQRAQAKIALAEVLAKLAEAERAAQSSDQDFQSKMSIVSGDLIKELVKLNGVKYGANADVAVAKAKGQIDLITDAQVRERAAREALSLTPEGQALVQDAQAQVQGSGVLNAQALLQKVDADLGVLSKTNAAQIPAYVQRLEAALRATGRPELQDFSLADSLGNINGQQTDPVLLRSLSSKLQTGFDAGMKAGTAREEAAVQRDTAAETLRRIGASNDPVLQELVVAATTLLIAEPTRDMSPQVQAPPPTATLDEKRAYVQRASDGQATVRDDGRVVSAQPGSKLALDKAAGDFVSYEGFVRAYPAVRTTGGAVSGPDGLALTGQAYSRSGPTADTIAAIAKLRANVERQMEDLDRVALDPLSQARQDANAASAGFGGYQDPDFARRAATRTAVAERRDLRGEDRAARDQRVLGGVEAAPLREKVVAVVRQGGRAVGAGLGALGERLRSNKPPEIAAPDFGPPQAAAAPTPQPSDQDRQAAGTLWDAALKTKTPEEALLYINEMFRLAPNDPEVRRDGARLLRERGLGSRADIMEQEADDLEFNAAQTARTARPDDTIKPSLAKTPAPTLAEAARAQESMETNVGRTPILEPWQPQVPGRQNRIAQPGTDYQDALVPGSTLGEKTGRGPLGLFSMGDLGTQASKTATGASSNPEVALQQPEAPRPRPTAQDMVTGLGATLGDQDEGASKPASPPPPELDQQDAKYWRQFQAQLPQDQPPLDPQVTSASTATNVMDMPTFETPDATLLLKRKQMGLVNGATQ